MAIPVQDIIQSYITNKDNRQRYLKEFKNLSNYSRFMGDSYNDIIVVRRITEGNTITLPVNQVFTNVDNISDFGAQFVGREAELTYDAMSMTLGRNSFIMKLTEADWQQRMAGRDFMADLKDNLLSIADTQLNTRIVQSFPLALNWQSTSALIANNTNASNKTWDWAMLKTNMLAVGIDTPGVSGDVVSSQRIVFGNDMNIDQATGNLIAGAATIKATLNNAAFTIDNAASTVAHIRKIIKLAQIGNRITPKTDLNFLENKIRPYKESRGREGFGEPLYLKLISPSEYEYLVTTDEWKAQVTRGIRENGSQPTILFGSKYKGTIEGAMIVVEDLLENMLVPCLNGGTAAYSVTLGAGSILYGISGKPEIREEYSNLQTIVRLGHFDISSLRAIKFASKSNSLARGLGSGNVAVENGMIHSFSRIK